MKNKKFTLNPNETINIKINANFIKLVSSLYSVNIKGFIDESDFNKSKKQDSVNIDLVKGRGISLNSSYYNWTITNKGILADTIEIIFGFGLVSDDTVAGVVQVDNEVQTTKVNKTLKNNQYIVYIWAYSNTSNTNTQIFNTIGSGKKLHIKKLYVGSRANTDTYDLAITDSLLGTTTEDSTSLSGFYIANKNGGGNTSSVEVRRGNLGSIYDTVCKFTTSETNRKTSEPFGNEIIDSKDDGIILNEGQGLTVASWITLTNVDLLIEFEELDSASQTLVA